MWQFLGPLLIGGRTVIADHETMCDPPRLFETIRAAGVTLIELVPPSLQSLLQHAAGLSAGAKPADVAVRHGHRRTRPAFARERMVRAVSGSAVGECLWTDRGGRRHLPGDRDRAARTGRLTVPIGRPLANLQLHACSTPSSTPCLGRWGNLCRGSRRRRRLRREAQTEASFVANLFDTEGLEAMLYRTGDLGRWRPDGQLNLAGRIDDQVKISGFRIELGEIETVLDRHPGFSAVVVQRDEAGEKRSLRTSCPRPDKDGTRSPRDQADQVATWEILHDKDYGQASESADLTRNTIGWDSTYTGLPIPDEEMCEYVDRTVERILALGPRKILEIGCGTGLLAFRLVPHCDDTGAPTLVGGNRPPAAAPRTDAGRPGGDAAAPGGGELRRHPDRFRRRHPQLGRPVFPRR